MQQRRLQNTIWLLSSSTAVKEETVVKYCLLALLFVHVSINLVVHIYYPNSICGLDTSTLSVQNIALSVCILSKVCLEASLLVFRHVYWNMVTPDVTSFPAPASLSWGECSIMSAYMALIRARCIYILHWKNVGCCWSMAVRSLHSKPVCPYRWATAATHTYLIKDIKTLFPFTDRWMIQWLTYAELWHKNNNISQ